MTEHSQNLNNEVEELQRTNEEELQQLKLIKDENIMDLKTTEENIKTMQSQVITLRIEIEQKIAANKLLEEHHASLGEKKNQLRNMIEEEAIRLTEELDAISLEAEQSMKKRDELEITVKALRETSEQEERHALEIQLLKEQLNEEIEYLQTESEQVAKDLKVFLLSLPFLIYLGIY